MSEKEDLIEYIKFWHGDHTPEYMKREGLGDPGDSCEIYNAIIKHNNRQITDDELIAIAKEVDDGIIDSFENSRKN